MATRRRSPEGDLVIHSDRGVQASSPHGRLARGSKTSASPPSMGAVGSAYDNAMVEAFWGRMQVELLNRKRWTTRIELATAIHDYIELFHNTRRRHSALGMLSPTDYEANYLKTTKAA
jgi:transposase InsO family protein